MNNKPHFFNDLHYRVFSWLERDSAIGVGSQQLDGGRLGIATDVGPERDENQDRVVALRTMDSDGNDQILVIVSDGMGGMRDGRVCASLAASGLIVAFLKNRSGGLADRLATAVRQANDVVFQRYRGDGGATISAVCMTSSGDAYGVNVGDSRIYAYCHGQLVLVTVDDTIAGQVGFARARTESNALLQFVGVGPDIAPHIVRLPNDTQWVVLTTDGAHCIPHDALRLIVANTRNALEMSRRIVRVAQWMGSRDNGTAASLQIIPRGTDVSIERSISVWDAWGEITFLNPVEGRQAPGPDVSSAHGVVPSFGSSSESEARATSIKRRRNTKVKDITFHKGKDIRNTKKREPDGHPLVVEITEIKDTPSEGNQ